MTRCTDAGGLHPTSISTLSLQKVHDLEWLALRLSTVVTPCHRKALRRVWTVRDMPASPHIFAWFCHAGSIGVLHTLRALRGRREDIALQQQEDIAAVGPLMVCLAGGAAGASALQALTGHLSPHLLHLFASLQNAHIRDCHTVRAVSRSLHVVLLHRALVFTV